MTKFESPLEKDSFEKLCGKTIQKWKFVLNHEPCKLYDVCKLWPKGVPMFGKFPISIQICCVKKIWGK